MSKEKSPAEALSHAKEEGSERGKSIVNGERLQGNSSLRSRGIIRVRWTYGMSMPHCISARTFAKALLNRYAQQNPNASAYDLGSLNGFVFEMAHSIDGAEGIDKTCEETVCKYWNNFTARAEGLHWIGACAILPSFLSLLIGCW
jgi:hypothetical protein